MAINYKRIAYKIEFRSLPSKGLSVKRHCLHPLMLQDAWVKAIKYDFAPDGAFQYFQVLEDFKDIFQATLCRTNEILMHLTKFSSNYRENPEGIAQFIYQKAPQLIGNPQAKLLASNAYHRFVEFYMYKRVHSGFFLRMLTDAAEIDPLILSQIKSGDLLSTIRCAKYSKNIRQAIKYWTYEGGISVEEAAKVVVHQEFNSTGSLPIKLPNWSRAFRKSLLSGGAPVFVNQFSRV